MQRDSADEGFTLIELLVVIIIIGILAAIAIPVYLNQRKKAYEAQTKSDIRNAETAEETYHTDYFSYTQSIPALMGEGMTTSGNTTSLTVISIRSDVNNDAAAGYCLSATSTSGRTFYFDSQSGLGITTTPCS